MHLVPPDAPKVNYKLPGFFGKFFELQQVMWTTNAGLTDRHTYDSRPDAWPRLLRGIVSLIPSSVHLASNNKLQNFWVKDHRQIYLIGNPVVWWLSTAAVLVYAVVRGSLILRAQRGYRDFDNSTSPSSVHPASTNTGLQLKLSNTTPYAASYSSGGSCTTSPSSLWAVNYSCITIFLRCTLPFCLVVLCSTS